MLPVLSVALMRESDRAAIEGGIPSRELMRRAAEGIFHAASWKEPVAVVCGSGNNAGDGYALALLLNEAGIGCAVYRVSPRVSEDGGYYLGLCETAGIGVYDFAEHPELSGYASIADCIFGTGFRGEAQGLERQAILEINACQEKGAFVVSADINSGLGGDSGMGADAVTSDLTVSVGYFQPGHFLGRAMDVMREKRAVDIGIVPSGEAGRYALFEASDAARAFPPRKHFSNKSTYGYIALIGGSARYSGAIRLAAMANAAMRAGAGVVKLAAPAGLSPILAPEILEATLFPMPEKDGGLLFDEDSLAELTRGVKSAAFGMGAGGGEETEKIVSWLLTHFPGALILDADGLNALARLGEEGRNLLRASPGHVILTPHTMEFARLTRKSVGEILSSPIPFAEEYARETGTTVLLKGPTTVVTNGGRTFLVDRGCPGMATAGSGDVLSGILSATAAVCSDPLEAAASAAWVNGRAGELAEAESGAVSMIASDTVKKIAEAVKQLAASPSGMK